MKSPSGLDQHASTPNVPSNGEACVVHVTPSGLLATARVAAAFRPTATKRFRSGDQQTPERNPPENGDVCVVHVIPSGEVAIVPDPLTTTKRPSAGDQQQAFSDDGSGFPLTVHADPSGEVHAAFVTGNDGDGPAV